MTLKDRRYEGFTLIEILVVVGLIAILAAVTIIAINPAKNFQQTRDAQRSADVTAILNAVTQYTSEEGNTIEGLLVAVGVTGSAAIPDSDTDTFWADEIVCDVDAEVPIVNGLEAGDDENNNVTLDEEEYWIELGAALVDEYIVSIPEDPSQAITYDDEADATPLVDTGYTMCVTTGGRIRITANPEQASAITVSR